MEICAISKRVYSLSLPRFLLTDNLGPFHWSLQLLPSASRCWSITRKTKEKAPTICFTSSIPGGKLSVNIFICYGMHIVFLGVMPGSIIVKHQICKFHLTVSVLNAPLCLITVQGTILHTSILPFCESAILCGLEVFPFNTSMRKEHGESHGGSIF